MITIDRRLANGDNDNGRGWQCSKYSWYLATGIRMNYGPHPDYGPCNGQDMVEYLVKNRGWKRHHKVAGAIFAYKSGAYGHTGTVVNPETNEVNDANSVQSLRVGTHIINLESKNAEYCVPPDYQDPTPAPAPEPAKPGIDDKSDDELARMVINGDFGNGEERKKALGDRYPAVQARVNAILAGEQSWTPKPDETPKYVVQPGDNLGNIIVKQGWATSAGLWGPNGDVARIAKANGIANPSVIHPGQVIRKA